MMFRFILRFFIVCFVFVGSVYGSDGSFHENSWQERWITLTGPLKQGGLIQGYVPNSALIWINDRKLRVTAGRFVFGVGRDVKTVKLRSVYQQQDFTWRIAVAERTYKIQRISGIEQKYVSPSDEALKRIRNDNHQVSKARQVDLAHHDYQETFIWPVEGSITGVYGSQRYFNGQPRRPHYGVDISAQAGTLVKAPAGGQVTLAHQDMYFSGKTLIIDHGHGVSSTFLHLERIDVNLDQYVTQGEVIGTVGSTGRSTGAHLDWRINWFDQRLDPQLLTIVE